MMRCVSPGHDYLQRERRTDCPSNATISEAFRLFFFSSERAVLSAAAFGLVRGTTFAAAAPPSPGRAASLGPSSPHVWSHAAASSESFSEPRTRTRHRFLGTPELVHQRLRALAATGGLARAAATLRAPGPGPRPGTTDDAGPTVQPSSLNQIPLRKPGQYKPSVIDACPLRGY